MSAVNWVLYVNKWQINSLIWISLEFHALYNLITISKWYNLNAISFIARRPTKINQLKRAKQVIPYWKKKNMHSLMCIETYCDE